MYFSLDEYRFTLGEVMDEEADGSVMTLRNWIARDIIRIGQKHKLGRWQFNIFDILRVRTNFSLTGFGIPPADANVYADFVVARAHLLFSLDESGELNLLKILRFESTIGQQTLFASIWEKKVTYIDETGRSVWWKRPKDGALTYKDELSSFYNTSSITVPIDRIITDTVMKYFRIASEEEGESFEHESSIDGMLLYFSNMTEDEKRRTMPKFSVQTLLKASISQEAITDVMRATKQFDPKQPIFTASDLLLIPGVLDDVVGEVQAALEGSDDEK